MLVKDWMSRPVVTISPRSSMQMARDLMDQNAIRALPVVHDDVIVGLLTDRNLKRAEASDATTLDTYELGYLLQKVTVAEIMTADPLTLSFDATLPEAADLFLEHKLEAAPVVAGGDQLVGVLTQTDLQRAIIKLTSFGRRGVLFGIRLPDASDALMAVVSAVEAVQGRLASLLTGGGETEGGHLDAHIHVCGLNRSVLPDLFASMSQKGILLYMVDFRTGERKLFHRSSH